MKLNSCKQKHRMLVMGIPRSLVDNESARMVSLCKAHKDGIMGQEYLFDFDSSALEDQIKSHYQHQFSGRFAKKNQHRVRQSIPYLGWASPLFADKVISQKFIFTTTPPSPLPPLSLPHLIVLDYLGYEVTRLDEAKRLSFVDGFKALNTIIQQGGPISYDLRLSEIEWGHLLGSYLVQWPYLLLALAQLLQEVRCWNNLDNERRTSLQELHWAIGKLLGINSRKWLSKEVEGSTVLPNPFGALHQACLANLAMRPDLVKCDSLSTFMSDATASIPEGQRSVKPKNLITSQTLVHQAALRTLQLLLNHLDDVQIIAIINQESDLTELMERHPANATIFLPSGNLLDDAMDGDKNESGSKLVNIPQDRESPRETAAWWRAHLLDRLASQNLFSDCENALRVGEGYCAFQSVLSQIDAITPDELKQEISHLLTPITELVLPGHRWAYHGHRLHQAVSKFCHVALCEEIALEANHGHLQDELAWLWHTAGNYLLTRKAFDETQSLELRLRLERLRESLEQLTDLALKECLLGMLGQMTISLTQGAVRAGLEPLMNLMDSWNQAVQASADRIARRDERIEELRHSIKMHVDNCCEDSCLGEPQSTQEIDIELLNRSPEQEALANEILELRGKNRQLRQEKEALSCRLREQQQMNVGLRHYRDRTLVKLSNYRASHEKNEIYEPALVERIDCIAKGLIGTLENTSITKVMELAQAFSQGRIKFTPSAFKAASEYSRQDYQPLTLMTILLKLMDVYLPIYKAAGDNEARLVFGDAYSATESDTTINNDKLRKMREWVVDGERRLVGQHLAVGGRFLRLYFWVRPDRESLVIPYLGYHLENSQTN